MLPEYIKKNLTAILTILLVAIAVGSIAYSYRNSMIQARNRLEARDQESAPIALLSETEFDWGKISRDQKVTRDFTLSNPSENSLEITLLVTSCGCTTAELLVDNLTVKIPTALAPKSSAIIRITFDPAAHVYTEASSGRQYFLVSLRSNTPPTPSSICSAVSIKSIQLTAVP